MIFDGKKFAKDLEELIKVAVEQLVKKPKIVSILVGNDPASELYTRLKKQAAIRVGIDFVVVNLEPSATLKDIGSTIESYGDDEEVTGIMVQLPIPGVEKDDIAQILTKIPIKKDVDGLVWEKSGIKPATVESILNILEQASQLEGEDLWKRKFVLLGSGGAVGRPLLYHLRKRGITVGEVEWNTPNSREVILEGDVIISCVGKPGLVQAQMVKQNIVAIDVGMSQREGKVVGDMENDVYQKASFAVPVPGGVGPVTIACLMKNATELCLGSKLDLVL